MSEPTVNGMLPLAAALADGDVDLAQALLGSSLTMDDRGQFGQTLLHDLVAANSPGGVVEALRLGADPNARDHQGRTPVHDAAELASPVCLVLLLRGGGSVKSLDIYGRSAAYYATLSGAGECLRVLAKHGCDLRRETRDGGLVSVALEFSRMGLFEALLGLGADINAADTHGQTSLHLAMQFRNLDAAEWLLDHGASFLSTDSLGHTPLHYSWNKASREMILRRPNARKALLAWILAGGTAFAPDVMRRIRMP